MAAVRQLSLAMMAAGDKQQQMTLQIYLNQLGRKNNGKEWEAPVRRRKRYSREPTKHKPTATAAAATTTATTNTIGSQQQVASVFQPVANETNDDLLNKKNAGKVSVVPLAQAANEQQHQQQKKGTKRKNKKSRQPGKPNKKRARKTKNETKRTKKTVKSVAVNSNNKKEQAIKSKVPPLASDLQQRLANVARCGGTTAMPMVMMTQVEPQLAWEAMQYGISASPSTEFFYGTQNALEQIGSGYYSPMSISPRPASTTVDHTGMFRPIQDAYCPSSPSSFATRSDSFSFSVTPSSSFEDVQCAIVPDLSQEDLYCHGYPSMHNPDLDFLSMPHHVDSNGCQGVPPGASDTSGPDDGASAAAPQLTVPLLLTEFLVQDEDIREATGYGHDHDDVHLVLGIDPAGSLTLPESTDDTGFSFLSEFLLQEGI